MDNLLAIKQSKLKEWTQRNIIKKDLINFVGFQFKQLSRKRLRIPIQLYHL